MRKPDQLVTRRGVVAGLSAGAAVCATDVRAQAGQPIDHSAESIHQERAFAAPPARVYGVLTDARQFQQVVLLSDAVRSGMVKTTPPAQIGKEGETFTLFGGIIAGRQIELVPNVRIVQAWRPADWQAGIYSIARFQLAARSTGTQLIFDHTGFPKGQAQHLADGWNTNYWQPLEKYLSRPR